MKRVGTKSRSLALLLLTVVCLCGVVSCSGSGAESGPVDGHFLKGPSLSPPDDPLTHQPVGMSLQAPPHPLGILRHAVFFRFKETSSKEDIDGVVQAFRELPEKIEEIVDFQWGVNNSPEMRDDGFTHCFLLSFADAKGRKAYLPHDAHKAFGDVLRPHMADVFVIDYYGRRRQAKLEEELKHAVFFKFKEEASEEEVKDIENAFAQLPSAIPAIKGFEWGRNNSPEKHDDGFTHCFMVTFDSEEGRETYLPHEAHEAFVEKLKPVLDKSRVLDFWAKK